MLPWKFFQKVSPFGQTAPANTSCPLSRGAAPPRRRTPQRSSARVWQARSSEVFDCSTDDFVTPANRSSMRRSRSPVRILRKTSTQHPLVRQTPSRPYAEDGLLIRHRSFTLIEACASLATMMRLANRKLSSGMRCATNMSQDRSETATCPPCAPPKPDPTTSGVLSNAWKLAYIARTVLLVEVLARVVPARPSADGREVRVRRHDSGDPSQALQRARLERDVPNPSNLERLDDFCLLP